MSTNLTENDCLRIAGKSFRSRLMTGSGKFSSKELMLLALEASEAQIVTVALRRVNLNNPEDNLASFLDHNRFQLLPNTSGARTAAEAVRLARLARSAGLGDWVKLEVTPDVRYLLPDAEDTLKAAEILIKDGFTVLPYINADPVLAKRLQEVGCATVMPLGSPIGSNRGFHTEDMVRIIIEQATVPVVVDAGLGRPSDAVRAMEIGADAVLINTAIATATDPTLMAQAFAEAVRAGRKGYLAGLAAETITATASSPLDWISPYAENNS